MSGLILSASPPRSAIAFRIAVEVNDRGHPGEVLQQHARGGEGDLAARLPGRDPAGNRGDVVVVPGPEHVLEQDAQRVGQALDAVDRVETMDLIAPVSDVQLRARHRLDSIKG